MPGVLWCSCGFPQWFKNNSDESRRQPEVAAVMQWTRSHQFVLSASLHGVSRREAFLGLMPGVPPLVVWPETARGVAPAATWLMMVPLLNRILKGKCC